MRRSGLFAIMCLSLASAGWAEWPSPMVSKPVMVGGDAEMDACPTLMHVAFRKPTADSFAAVRLRPDTSARIRDQLPAGYQVMACETAGDWIGVVYRPVVNLDSDAVADCGVNSPITERTPYRGPCVSGWVAARLLKVVAG